MQCQSAVSTSTPISIWPAALDRSAQKTTFSHVSFISSRWRAWILTLVSIHYLLFWLPSPGSIRRAFLLFVSIFSGDNLSSVFLCSYFCVLRSLHFHSCLQLTFQFSYPSASVKLSRHLPSIPNGYTLVRSVFSQHKKFSIKAALVLSLTFRRRTPFTAMMTTSDSA